MTSDSTYGQSTLVGSWDGTTWSAIPSSAPGSGSALDGVSGAGATFCQAAGYTFNGTGRIRTVIAAPLDGRGYWLVAADGRVFAFAAPFFGAG
jgi:hypothetical protein